MPGRIATGLLVALLAVSARPKSLGVPSDFSSISAALAKAQKGDTVLVAEGLYRENVYLNPGVVLRSQVHLGARIDGRGRGAAVTLATDATLIGFEVRNGTIGVLSKSAGGRVLMCRIVNNLESGLMCVGHLPEVRDNVIAFNKGSGIQGWDVRSTMSTVAHNTIAYNENHGIALGGNSDVVVENSIIAFNGQFGLKVDAETVRTRLIGNNLFRNSAGSPPLQSENLSADPMFADPYRLDFSLKSGSKCIRAGTDRQNLGARSPQE
jgi:hypothetical protein